jgi:hypothetical protein
VLQQQKQSCHSKDASVPPLRPSRCEPADRTMYVQKMKHQQKRSRPSSCRACQTRKGGRPAAAGAARGPAGICAVTAPPMDASLLRQRLMACSAPLNAWWQASVEERFKLASSKAFRYALGINYVVC